MNTCCVILNYNDSSTTMKLVKSIINYKILDYVVIVDNCSVDNSYEVLSELKSSKVHLLRTERNGGYGYGNNKGILYAYNELDAGYILIANPDVEFDEQGISELRDVLFNNSNICAASMIALDAEGKVQNNIAWAIPSLKKFVLSTSAIYNKINNNINHKNNIHKSDKLYFYY